MNTNPAEQMLRDRYGIGDSPPQAAAGDCRAGSALSSLLARFGIVAAPGCRCLEMARRMDERGCDWCASDEGMAAILAVLRLEAARRRIPYVDAAARLVVRRAISNARRAALSHRPGPVK